MKGEASKVWYERELIVLYKKMDGNFGVGKAE